MGLFCLVSFIGAWRSRDNPTPVVRAALVMLSPTIVALVIYAIVVIHALTNIVEVLRFVVFVPLLIAAFCVVALSSATARLPRRFDKYPSYEFIAILTSGFVAVATFVWLGFFLFCC
jgi:hypothetical protein